MGEGAVVGARGEPQDVAHHGVNVHVVQGAEAVAAPEGGAVGGQERVHAGQGVVIAMVPHCSGESTSYRHSLGCGATAPLPSSLTSQTSVLTKAQRKGAAGATTGGSRSPFPLPQTPQVFSNTGLTPWFSLPLISSFQCLTFPAFPFPFFMPKLERMVPLLNDSVARMQVFTSQILGSHLSLQSGHFNYLLKIRHLSLDSVQFEHIKYPRFMLIRLVTSAEGTPKESKPKDKGPLCLWQAHSKTFVSIRSGVLGHLVGF